MSTYSGSPSVNPYWHYDPYGYQPNVSVPFNTNISVNTPPPTLHPSFDMYYNNNNNNSRFADSGYLSRTPTPPTPVQIPSPQPVSIRQDQDIKDIDNTFDENKPRLPYVKRTRIQYTLQQLQILEEAFQNNHYPEVTTVDGLAEILGVRHEKISIWFQNRRSRFKRQQKPKASSSSASASSLTHDNAKKITQSFPMPSPSYDPSTSYYPSYFWPSPIVDNRTTGVSYSTTTPHTSPYYDTSANPMWNTNHPAYSSPTAWHQAASSTMNISLSSAPSPPPPSVLSEHLSLI